MRPRDYQIIADGKGQIRAGWLALIQLIITAAILLGMGIWMYKVTL